MEKKIIICLSMLLLLIAGLNGCFGPQSTDYFHQSYVVTEQTILRVANINGNVEISGWDGNNVTVDAVKKSTLGKGELDKITIDVTTNGLYLNIETKYTGLSTIQGSVDYNIKVPRTMQIESVTSTNGAIQITESTGNVTTMSSNGPILITDVTGYVSAETSNGRIEISGTTGIKDIRTSNGPITVEIADFQQNTRIDTSNGGITVYLNPLLNATIEMTTSNSKINIEGITLDTEVLEDTHVLGTLGTDGHRLDIRTSNGQIQLHKLGN